MIMYCTRSITWENEVLSLSDGSFLRLHCCPRKEDRVGVGGGWAEACSPKWVAVKTSFLEICVISNKDRDILYSTICSCLHNIKYKNLLNYLLGKLFKYCPLLK